VGSLEGAACGAELGSAGKGPTAFAGADPDSADGEGGASAAAGAAGIWAGGTPTGGLGGNAPAAKVKNEEAAMHPPETSSRESLFMGRSMSPLLRFGHSN